MLDDKILVQDKQNRFCIFVIYLSKRNKYIYWSKISKKIREILRLFCLDIEAIKVYELTKISRLTINKIFDKIIERIVEYCEENR